MSISHTVNVAAMEPDRVERAVPRRSDVRQQPVHGRRSQSELREHATQVRARNRSSRLERRTVGGHYGEAAFRTGGRADTSHGVRAVGRSPRETARIAPAPQLLDVLGTSIYGAAFAVVVVVLLLLVCVG